MDGLQKAIELCGNPSRFAKTMGYSPQRVNTWIKRSGGKVPAECCPDIEHKLNGRVTCEELRPDVSWWVLRGKAANDSTQPVEQEVRDAA